MAVPSIVIKTYNVFIISNRLDPPFADTMADPSIVATIIMHGEWQGQPRHAQFNFTTKTELPAIKFDVPNQGTSWDYETVVYRPAAEYERWLDLLRHEKPLQLVIGEDPPFVMFNTGAEPIGEGGFDFSQ
ncbi:MAG: hypothetical protein ABIF77_15500 [bacterium]